MRAVAVPPGSIGAAWPVVEPWIAAALRRGLADQSPHAIRGYLEHGGMQLWLAWDDDAGRPRGCCVTEIIESVRGRVCNLVIGAGRDLAAWEHLVDWIEQWAGENGCRRLELTGRAGWERRWQGRGWRKIRTTVEKVIGDG